eukprot:scaffold51660_cov37-Phaeocystis_antarctica.AAC.2
MAAWSTSRRGRLRGVHSNISFLSAVQCGRSSLGRVPRGMPGNLPGPSDAGSGSSTLSRPARLLQWRMVALLKILAKFPGKEESCWCTTQC